MGDMEKAVAYRASLPPTIIDKAVDAAVELSPIGDAKDINDGIKEGSLGKIIIGAVGIVPIGKAIKRIKKLAKAAHIAEEVKDASKSA